MIISIIKKTRYHQGHRYGFSGLLKWFLKGYVVEEKALDYIPLLDTRIVDVTQTQDLDIAHRIMLTLPKRHAQDDEIIAHIYGLQIL